MFPFSQFKSSHHYFHSVYTIEIQSITKSSFTVLNRKITVQQEKSGATLKNEVNSAKQLYVAREYIHFLAPVSSLLDGSGQSRNRSH